METQSILLQTLNYVQCIQVKDLTGDLRFLYWYLWRLKSSGMLCCIKWQTVANILEECAAFTV